METHYNNLNLKIRISFAVNKYFHTVTTFGYLFTLNIAFYRRLILARVQVPSLNKELCRQWDSNQRTLFPKATASTRWTPWATPADKKNEVSGRLIHP